MNNDSGKKFSRKLVQASIEPAIQKLVEELGLEADPDNVYRVVRALGHIAAKYAQKIHMPPQPFVSEMVRAYLSELPKKVVVQEPNTSLS